GNAHQLGPIAAGGRGVPADVYERGGANLGCAGSGVPDGLWARDALSYETLGDIRIAGGEGGRDRAAGPEVREAEGPERLQNYRAYDTGGGHRGDCRGKAPLQHRFSSSRDAVGRVREMPRVRGEIHQRKSGRDQEGAGSAAGVFAGRDL